ncbi:unnamed protein product (macronuclear) [Paramecium tetraurelia]|uniref:Uncharacterized protein n=1 Tax=Paramecium tetraurelia TaxID=5888 RepID=A0DEA0_PARTE|nr:uncharacterized protein GSPATT00039451001 [Paramecium tetraurelia]CAK81367.1 unnamed protein product [Paramecium tetraurelia]|eukprot:XP_001448764.1 hypothetical protein (macronuclear) [Paramecium tetraurelia strain d4-2]
MDNQHHTSNKISYELIVQKQHFQLNSCNAIAIDTNNSIVVFAEESRIITCQFKYQFKISSSNTNTLNFFKFRQQFISGCQNSSIYIWSINMIANSKYIQKLQANSGSTLCMCISKLEDKVVTGHYENTIKIWGQFELHPQQWSCVENLFDHAGAVYGLSMNENQNKLISCSNDQQILVYQISQQSYNWILQQIIKNDGLRLCFIKNDVFVFQPFAANNLQIYLFDKLSQEFIKTQKVQIQEGGQFCNESFPCIYNPKKGIIFDKSSYNLNILKCKSKQDLRIKDNNQIDFILEDSIDFGDEYFCGSISDDGEYLIIWNNEQKELSIRKYKEQ